MIKNCITSKTNFTGSTTIIEAISRRGNEELNDIIKKEVLPGIKKFETSVDYFQVKSPAEAKIKDEISNYKIIFKKNPKNKELFEHLFTVSHNKFQQFINLTTVKKVFGFFVVKDGVEGRDIVTRSKEKFVAHLSGLIKRHLQH